MGQYMCCKIIGKYEHKQAKLVKLRTEFLGLYLSF